MQQETSQSPVQAALNLGPLQVAALALVGLIAIAGAVVVAVQPHTLSMSTYSTQVIPECVAALGLLGIGKGLHLGLAGRAEQKILADLPDALTSVQKGDVVEAMSRVEQDLQPGETLPTDEEEAASPPPADTSLPPSPADVPPPAVDAPPSPADVAVTTPTRVEAPPAVAVDLPTPEEVAAAEDVLARAAAAPSATTQQ